MKLQRFYFFFLIFYFSFLNAFSQSDHLSTQNKKAKLYFSSALDFYQTKNNERALTELRKATQQDPLFTEAYILQGNIYADEGEYEKGIEFFQSAIKTNNPHYPNLYLTLAKLQLISGRYVDARLNFQRFLALDGIPEQIRQESLRGLKSSEFAIQCMAHPVPFSPVNMGDSINSECDEYINAITADEEMLYFTRLNPKNAQTLDKTQNGEEDFYVAHSVDSTWLKAVNLGPPINTHGNEGALSISPDGKYLFFAACERPDGFGRCDIYWSHRLGDRWGEPENLGEMVNSPQWDSQPSFSSDGKTLYFVSNRPGGKGSSDIWTTELQRDNQWSTPVNLGDSINTREKEMSPFIHPDDQTLYFSSKGHPGMGGLDLFYSRKNVNGEWEHPINMGYPINTNADEITLVVNAKGDLAYISSDKLGGKGRQDIYKFPLYKEAQPLLTTYFKGIVYNEETKEKLEARFELIDLSSSKTIAESRSDRLTGEFLLVLPSEKNYALNVSKDGYLFFSDNFSLRAANSQKTPFIKNVPLKPIRVGEAVVLKNIFFDSDKFILKDESLVELQKLLGLLQRNPKLQIELSGHTDNIGTEVHNLELSGNRANAVYEYLIQHGIARTRLSHAGYGFSKPVDSNFTEQGRANNRRTEFKVIGN